MGDTVEITVNQSSIRYLPIEGILIILPLLACSFSQQLASSLVLSLILSTLDVHGRATKRSSISLDSDFEKVSIDMKPFGNVCGGVLVDFVNQFTVSLMLNVCMALNFPAVAGANMRAADTASHQAVGLTGQR